jgi:hypothetical protein
MRTVHCDATEVIVDKLRALEPRQQAIIGLLRWCVRARALSTPLCDRSTLLHRERCLMCVRAVWRPADSGIRRPTYRQVTSSASRIASVVSCDVKSNGIHTTPQDSHTSRNGARRIFHKRASRRAVYQAVQRALWPREGDAQCAALPRVAPVPASFSPCFVCNILSAIHAKHIRIAHASPRANGRLAPAGLRRCGLTRRSRQLARI